MYAVLQHPCQMSTGTSCSVNLSTDYIVHRIQSQYFYFVIGCQKTIFYKKKLPVS